MKVKDLIKILKTLPPNYQVILASDAEGNSYSPLSDDAYCTAEYTPETTYYGDVWTEENAKEDGRKYKENCIVFWPTN